MSLFLNVKIEVFYPDTDIDNSLSVYSYNDGGAGRLRLGVINDGANYNYGVVLVEKENLALNPYGSL